MGSTIKKNARALYGPASLDAQGEDAPGTHGGPGSGDVTTARVAGAAKAADEARAAGAARATGEARAASGGRARARMCTSRHAR